MNFKLKTRQELWCYTSPPTHINPFSFLVSFIRIYVNIFFTLKAIPVLTSKTTLKYFFMSSTVAYLNIFLGFFLYFKSGMESAQKAKNVGHEKVFYDFCHASNLPRREVKITVEKLSFEAVFA